MALQRNPTTGFFNRNPISGKLIRVDSGNPFDGSSSSASPDIDEGGGSSSSSSSGNECCCESDWVIAYPCELSVGNAFRDNTPNGLVYNYCELTPGDYNPPCLWLKFNDIKQYLLSGSSSSSCPPHDTIMDGTESFCCTGTFNFYNNGDKRVCYSVQCQNTQPLPDGAIKATNIVVNPDGCISNTGDFISPCCCTPGNGYSGPCACNQMPCELTVTTTGLMNNRSYFGQADDPGPDCTGKVNCLWFYDGQVPDATLYLGTNGAIDGAFCGYTSDIIPNAMTYAYATGMPNNVPPWDGTYQTITYSCQWQYTPGWAISAYTMGDKVAGNSYGFGLLVCDLLEQMPDGSYQYAGVAFWGYPSNFKDNCVYPGQDCNNPGTCGNLVNFYGEPFSLSPTPMGNYRGIGTATLTASNPDNNPLRACPPCPSSSSSSCSSSSNSSSSCSSSSSGNSSSSSCSSCSSSSHSSSSSNSSSSNASSSSNTSSSSNGGGSGSGTSSSSSCSTSSIISPSSSSAIGNYGSSSSSTAPAYCYGCCNTIYVVLSGGTPIDGVLISLNNYGSCYWRSSLSQIYADDYGWIFNTLIPTLDGACQITMTAPLSPCPPTTGWTVWSNTCVGTPAITVSCSSVITSSSSSSSSSTVNSCTSPTACGNCSDTPISINVYFDSVIMFTNCLVCGDYSYTVYRGTINDEKTHQRWNLTQTSSCTWSTTGIASNFQINRYYSDDCTGSVVDITGPVTVTLTVGADSTTLLYTMAASTGETLVFFKSTFGNFGCGLVQTVDSDIAAQMCATDVYLGHGGYAVITPCGNAVASSSSSSSSSSVNACIVTPDIFSNAVSYFAFEAYFPPGTYTITYVSGAISYVNGIGGGGGDPEWCVSDGFGNYQIVYNGGTNQEQWPDADDQLVDTDVAATQVGLSVVITHTGGTIGVFCNDSVYGDNLIGPDVGAPTFAITPCVSSSSSSTGMMMRSDGPPLSPLMINKPVVPAQRVRDGGRRGRGCGCGK